MNLPASWPGSKVRLMPRVEGLFPQHRHRIYVFGGAGGEVIGTTPAYLETFNDINQDVYNFFDIMKNDVDALCQRLKTIPFSERVFREARNLLDSGEGSRLDRAEAFAIVANQSRCTADPTMRPLWSINYKIHKNMVRWQGLEETLRAVSSRFKTVQLLDSWSWESVLDRFDRPETGAFFCLDPPYPLSTLRTQTPFYRHSLSEADHERLLIRLHSLRSPWMLFGFHCPLYDAYLDEPLEFRQVTKISPKSKRPLRVQCVWVSY